MNWLAHLYLSDPVPTFLVGNLLPDLLPLSSLGNLHSDFKPGVEQHLRIDSFTDSHPLFRQSVNRVPPPLRRFGGILVDVFYDHFLAINWTLYSSKPLPTFAAEVYASFDSCRAHIPLEAYARLELIKANNLLCSYGDLDGLSVALERIAMRLSRSVPLADGVVVLEEQYQSFASDFAAFFPKLCAHVAGATDPSRKL